MKKISMAVAVLCMTGVVLGQGALTPPGAPAPTRKTLDQVEPRIDLRTVEGRAGYCHVILEPGSYFMSQNLSVTNSSGILIQVSGVTLDLNGFELSHDSRDNGMGICLLSGASHCVVRNGSIDGFDFGVYMDRDSSFYPEAVQFKDLLVSGCEIFGICAPTGVQVLDCRAIGNAGSGIVCGDGAFVRGCLAQNNFGSGIYAGMGASVMDCSAYNNSGEYGIYCGAGSLIRGCSAIANRGLSTRSIGIYADEGSSVFQCVSSYNSYYSSPSSGEQGCGFFVETGSSVKDCTAIGNRGDGIRMDSECNVSMCTAKENGASSGEGAGIHCLGSGNRIYENMFSHNDRGLEVEVSGNFISKNSAFSNSTNWVVAASNACFVVRRISCPAISGDAGGTAPGPNNSELNYTY